MKNTVIYDYEEVEDEINEIIKKSASNTYPFMEIENNWKTECDLPIRHYSIGSGIKHIVFFCSISRRRDSIYRIFDFCYELYSRK